MLQSVQNEGNQRHSVAAKKRAHTVDATAAGTLKMTLITEFKFRTMNIVASRLAKNLRMRSVC